MALKISVDSFSWFYSSFWRLGWIWSLVIQMQVVHSDLLGDIYIIISHLSAHYSDLYLFYRT